MAARDVKFLANLGLHGSLRFLETNSDFPASPSIGDVILKGTELFAYVKIGDFETWYPFANKTNAYIHTQGVAQLDWTVTHNLGTTDIWTQIRDSNNDIVYASMDNITANSFQLHFTEAITGTVVVVAPDSIDVPAVTTSIIQVGNVEITGSNITINGQAVLTGGSFATVATSGLFADLLSKPTTLGGYGITDAQPLDADLSAIAALNTTGFLKRTGVDTWALDNSTYLTANQNITISGDASGSGTTAITLTLANSGVTAGDYFKTTVNAKGLVTAGSNPTTLSGFGITDAAPLSHVGSGGSAHAAASTSTSGFMSSTDKTKLDGIEANANNYSLPVADTTTLGGVKDGAGVTIAVDGTLSANVLSVAGKTGAITLDNTDVGLGNVENKSSATIRSELTSGNVTTALGFTPENAANKNAANGYAGLDANSKISASQLPAIAITDTFVVASQAAMLALTAETGDVAVRTDLNKSFILQGTNPATLGHWQELLTPTDLVQSVNGMTGTVTISTISGNAGTATALQTARTITLDGDVSGSASFDGTQNITITTAVSNNSHDHTSIISGSNSASIDSDSFDVSVGGSQRMIVTSTGSVGVGTITPSTFSSTSGALAVVTPSPSLSSGGIVNYDSATSAQDVGGVLTLGGDDGVVSNRAFAALKGGKENATSGDYASYAAIATRSNSGSLTERMRITSSGNMLIGTTTDGSARLQVRNPTLSSGILSLVGANAFSYTFSSETSTNLTNGSRLNLSIASNNGEFSVSNSNGEIFRATSTRRLLIGTTTDDGNNRLQVSGSLAVGDNNVTNAGILISRFNSSVLARMHSLIPSANSPIYQHIFGGTWSGERAGSTDASHAYYMTASPAGVQFEIGRIPVSGAFTTANMSPAIVIKGVNNNVLIGTTTDNGSDRLQVAGSAYVSTFAGIGASGNSTTGLTIGNTSLTGSSQIGSYIRPVASSSATTYISGIFVNAGTAAASFTCADSYGIYVENPAKGSGSTITNAHGIQIANLTSGTNNYGISLALTSGANKWNIYASGSAKNYFAGHVGVGDSQTNPDPWSQGLSGQLTVGVGGNSVASAALGIQAGTTGSARIDMGNSTVLRAGIYAIEGSHLAIYTNNTNSGTTLTERMRIASSGNVLIGTTTDDGVNKLQVVGSAYVSTNIGAAVSPAVRMHAKNTGGEIHRLETTVARGSGNVFASFYDATGRKAYYGFGAASDTLQIVNELSGVDICGSSGISTGLHITATNRVMLGNLTDDSVNKLQIDGNGIRISTAQTPASASAAGVTGTICWDANYIYVCTATNTWKRTAISTW